MKEPKQVVNIQGTPYLEFLGEDGNLYYGTDAYNGYNNTFVVYGQNLAAAAQSQLKKGVKSDDLNKQVSYGWVYTNAPTGISSNGSTYTAKNLYKDVANLNTGEYKEFDNGLNIKRMTTNTGEEEYHITDKNGQIYAFNDPAAAAITLTNLTALQTQYNNKK